MTDLQLKLKELFGFDQFKGDQESIIRSVLDGHDTFVIMPTGGGKSLCYQLPAMILEGTAIIVSPLIALMKNQVDAMRYTSGQDVLAHFLNSSLSKAETLEVREDVLKGVTKLLYVAPETLSKDETIELLQQVKLSFFAIDEAHCISEWGHDFRPEYRRLRQAMDRIGSRVPLLTLTASATPKVQQDIVKNLGMENAARFVSSFNRPNLYYEVRHKPSDEMALHKEIIKFIKERPGKSGIIYCLTRKRVEDLAELLQINGIRALPYHAGLDAKTRASNQDQFLMEEVEVIVATIAFGMGIDKPDVRYVIHYDIPKSLEGYYQETGRAGRDGGEGVCVAFYSEKDVARLQKFYTDKNLTEQEQANQLVREVVSFAESSACRRMQLLQYFGEKPETEHCGNCDNCLHPMPTVEAGDECRYALETIIAMKQSFKASEVIEVMLGKKTSFVKNYRLDQIEEFGGGTDHPAEFWQAVLRHCRFEGLITQEVELFGILKITPLGEQFIRQPYPIMVACDHVFRDDNEDDVDGELVTAGAGGSSAADEALYAQLKGLLRSMAQKEGLPTHVIMDDRSLKDMTLQYPCTIDELSHCIGVGVGKAQKYGEPFVELIKRYVEENQIERPQDIIIHSAPTHGNLKIYIIQSTDRKKPLEDIAHSKGLSMEELLDEMERILASGSKINIDYHINETIDEDKQEELIEYWKTSETGSLEEALEDLADDDYFSEEDIRLMHIKFLSDFGH